MHAENKVGDIGAKAIAAALTTNTTLQELDLEGACPTPPRAAAPPLHTAGSPARR